MFYALAQRVNNSGPLPAPVTVKSAKELRNKLEHGLPSGHVSKADKPAYTLFKNGTLLADHILVSVTHQVADATLLTYSRKLTEQHAGLLERYSAHRQDSRPVVLHFQAGQDQQD